ncbi:hypothetical protein DB347_22680 [Opitutaceae bacterium EW11]|nr:hypothetical protein DB347_22680 [Opitutaceae bacterium EW11]
MSSVTKRHLSLTARITRRDYWPYPVGFFICCAALGFWQSSLGPGPVHDFAMLLIWPLIAVLALASSKRCRDANVAPWMGIVAVVIPFGLLILLILHPSKGANEFGPDPRDSAAP